MKAKSYDFITRIDSQYSAQWETQACVFDVHKIHSSCYGCVDHAGAHESGAYLGQGVTGKLDVRLSLHYGNLPYLLWRPIFDSSETFTDHAEYG